MQTPPSPNVLFLPVSPFVPFSLSSIRRVSERDGERARMATYKIFPPSMNLAMQFNPACYSQRRVPITNPSYRSSADPKTPNQLALPLVVYVVSDLLILPFRRNVPPDTPLFSLSLSLIHTPESRARTFGEKPRHHGSKLRRPAIPGFGQAHTLLNGPYNYFS
jgi:hypothetical protein